MPLAVPRSRLGCLQCKRRKVKCDEITPSCSNCTRREESCSYLEVTQFTGSASQSPQSDLSSSATYSRSPRALLDIELTHFFLVETLPSIISSPTRQAVWRRCIFPHSLGHPDILDAHLATAALHKYATTHPDPSYLHLAAEKQASLLPSFVRMLSTPTASTALSLFTLSALVTIQVFASGSLPFPIPSLLSFEAHLTPSSPPSPSAPRRFPALIAVLKIARGIQVVAQRCRPWLAEQGLGCILKTGASPKRPNPEACGALDELLLDLRLSPRVTAEKLRVYSEGVERTKRYLGRVEGDEGKEAVLSWPVGLEQGFVEALESHEAPALVMLAFWAASLHDTPRIRWWAAGWGRDVVEGIAEFLGEGWARYLRWPVAAVRGPERAGGDGCAASAAAADPMVF